jgi:hypothetical protein
MVRVRSVVRSAAVVVLALAVLAGAAGATGVEDRHSGGADAAAVQPPVAQNDTQGVPAPPQSLSVRTYVAPGSALDTLETADALSAVSGVTISDRPRVTKWDAFIVAVSAPGLTAAVNRQPSNETTRAFTTLVASDRASLRGYETGAGATALPLQDPDAISVLPAGEDRYFVVADLGDLRATLDENGNGLADDSRSGSIDPGSLYRLAFTFEGETTRLTTLVTARIATITGRRTGGDLRLYPLPAAGIDVRTTLAPGTRLTLRLDGTQGSMLSRRHVVRVPTGSLSAFTTPFDLGDTTPGTPFEVRVRHLGTTVNATTGEIVELTATLDAPETAPAGQSLSVPRATVGYPGFLLVSDADSGTVLSNRYVSAGTARNLALDIEAARAGDRLRVAAVADVDRDGTYDAGGPDRPFRRLGDPVVASVEVVAADADASAVATPTERPPTRTTTRTAAPTETTDPDPPDRGDGTFTPYTLTPVSAPGFGVLVALAAVLIAAGSVAARRSHGRR